jgi:hypothetical protein
MQLLLDQLGQLAVEEPVRAGGLEVFGLRWQAPAGPGYRTLDEAMGEQALDVTEISEGGNVPTLKVTNKGDTRVFLMAGEQLVGAKQNRVLNTSILLEAHTEVPIPVSCVEAGRWAYRSAKFASAGTSSHSKLRHAMTKQVHASYRRTGQCLSDQGAVWAEVDRKLTHHGSHSPSSALQQAYEDQQHTLADILGQLPAPEGCAGAVFAFGGRIAGVELFDRPETLAKLWPKLVRSYAIDALEENDSRPLTREKVGEWLQMARGAQTRSFKSPGLGEDVRLETAGLVGAGLVVEDQPVHVELFAEAAAV